MKKRKVSEEEVAHLYQFTRQHYVEFYDVQTELVDHLASSIEAQWQGNPEIPFEEALQKEFKKFGVFGFSDIVGKRQRAMEKKYWKWIWKETKIILARPKTVIPILLLFTSFYFLLNSVYGTYALLAVVFVFLLLVLFYVGRRSSNLKKKLKTGKKVYLLETIILNTGGLFSLTCMLL